MAFLLAHLIKNPPAMQETQIESLGQEDPLEKEMTTHFSILAQETPWTEDPGGLQSMRSQKLKYDLATKPPPPQVKKGFPGDSDRKEFTCNVGD